MPGAAVTTLAGGGAIGVNGSFLDGTGTTARFNLLWKATVFPNGVIVVADTDNHRIRLITPT